MKSNVIRRGNLADRLQEGTKHLAGNYHLQSLLGGSSRAALLWSFARVSHMALGIRHLFSESLQVNV